MSRLAIIALTGALSISVPLRAQITVPEVHIAGGNATSAEIPVSAAEAEYHVAVQGARIASASSATRLRAPEDSVRLAVLESAREWATRLTRTTPRGIQLDPYSSVTANAKHDPLARQSIAARLATPGLSVNDKAYTYHAAVLAFTEAASPERLPVAEQYMTALDAMGTGPTVGFYQFLAHRQLADVAYALGRTDDVIRHGTRAIAALARMEFYDRSAMFSNSAGPPFYAELVDALGGRPNAPTAIATLNAALLAATTASPELLAKNPAFNARAGGFRASATQMITVATRVGTKAQDIVSNAWVNYPKAGQISGADTMSLSDGKIHVLELGHYNCPQCIASLPALRNLQVQFPDIQVVYATATEGTWGNRLIEPDTEAANLTQFYTGKLNINFPIALWKAAKAENEDGGVTPENSGPNFANYPLAGKPNVYIIDGRGIIRRVYIEEITTAREHQIASLITFLTKEAAARTTIRAGYSATP